MKTYLADSLFEKYTLYAANLVFKDKTEADSKETDESRLNYQLMVKELSRLDYFSYITSGMHVEADLVLADVESRYIEKNQYYLDLRKITSTPFYIMRNMPHLAIIETSTGYKDITTTEEKEFQKIFTEELEYFNISQYRYDFSTSVLFTKISLIFLIFSTILRIIKNNYSLQITDDNVNEYYLNNFLVSNGFLYYNNMNYEKKKRFTKYIMDFHNSKGSLKVVKDIIDLLVDKDVNIYEYFLFYDDDSGSYKFLKVKPNEGFNKVFNENRYERELGYYEVTDADPSWLATEEDLIRKDIKFIKTKYISIESTTDLSSAIFELSFLLNKVKRYKDVFGKIYKFDLEGFASGVEMQDFVLFITLMSFKVSGYKTADIMYIPVNEDMIKYAVVPKNWEYQYGYDPLKTPQTVISDSVKETSSVHGIIDEIEAFKKHKKSDDNKTQIDKIRELRKTLNENYTHNYRTIIKDSTKVSAYQYLCKKYPNIKEILDEENESVINDKYLDSVDSLERMLLLYGQSTLKFKDIYSNLYLPKVLEIINFFKSLNAYIINFTNILCIERENRMDIVADSHSVTGIIRISNREINNGTNSGNPDYKPDEEFPNKEEIIDEEVDFMKDIENSEELLNTDSFGETTISSEDNKYTYRDSIVNEFPIPSANRNHLLYTSFSKYIPLITDYTDIFETDKRLSNIIKDNQRLYIDGQVIDFFGQEGAYKAIREKYGLSYFEFKDIVSKILLEYHELYGTVLNRLGIKKKDYVYTTNRNKHIPFLKKPYTYKRIQNKVEKTDILYKKVFERSSYTDVIHVYEYDKDSEKYVEAPVYTDKYRSLERKENPKNFDKNLLKKYSGLRTFKDFIEEIKEYNKLKQEEEDAIGSIPIVDVDILYGDTVS